MTNFELKRRTPKPWRTSYTRCRTTLEAEGCYLALKRPPTQGPEEIVVGWKDWLQQEAEDEMICLSDGRTIEQWRKPGEDNG